MEYQSKTGWSCHMCQSDNKQRNCCGRKTCEHSSFGGKTVEEMMHHMIAAHDYEKPDGYDDMLRKLRNKAKRNRKQRGR